LKRIRVSELIPGMITAEDIYSFSNQLVVEKDTVLTDEIIARLEYHSVLSIHINEGKGETGESMSSVAPLFASDDSQSGVKAPVFEKVRTVSDEDGGFATTPENLAYSSRIKATKQFREFEKSFMNNAEALKGHLNDIIENNSIDTEILLSSVTNLISKGTTTISMFDMLHNMRNYDDQTYVHSMSVALICNIFGKWLNMNEEDIKVLTIAGLLHDIGKIVIPENIIKKPGKLTVSEFNVVKTHTLEGYKILRKLNVDQRIQDAALLHHEKCDGTGYPLGRTGDNLPDFAKIIAIADVYDAMTASRVYRGPMCPFKVISIYEQEGLQKYESKYILEFLAHIGQTYLNNRVLLSDGREGDVMLIHREEVSRPLIKCLDGSFVDLAEERNVYIESLV